MQSTVDHSDVSFRVWLVRCEEHQPTQWHKPALAGAVLEPASSGCFSQHEATVYVRAFNEEMIRASGCLWAVAVPVEVHYRRDLTAGIDVGAVRDRFVAFASSGAV